MLSPIKLCKNHKRYKYRPNVSHEIQNTLTFLRQVDNIVVKQADKISTKVIMNHEDYIAEVKRQLSDRKYYRKLHESPHEKFKQEIQTKILTVRGSVCLSGFGDIIINENRISQFYILPKTHNIYDPSLPLGYPGETCVSLWFFKWDCVCVLIDNTL